MPEKVEEETYSLIFKSLKHPIRRKILRMLQGEQQSFSRILDTISIDSGHLSYHIENLGTLVRKFPDGKYGLSSIGNAAVNLMQGVEENPRMLAPIRLRSRRIRNVVLASLIVGLVLLASLYTYSYYSLQAEIRTRQDATVIVAGGFWMTLNRACMVLDSQLGQVKPENVEDLVRNFQMYGQSAWDFLRTLRSLHPDYDDLFSRIDDLFFSMFLGMPDEGVMNMFALLSWNRTIEVIAFQELNLTASPRISEMGHETAEAFANMHSLGIDPQRLDNAVSIASQLQEILDTWILKYSDSAYQMPAH